MSYFDDHYDGEDWYSGSGNRTVVCKNCGKRGLHWEDDNGRWVLCTAQDKIHNCKKKAPTDEGFEPT